MAVDFETLVPQLVAQAPFAAAALWVAKVYMQKHEAVVNQLVTAFREEAKGCQEQNKVLLQRIFQLEDKKADKQ